MGALFRTMRTMVPEMLMDAFGAESGRLSEVAAETADAAFARPSPCLPWTVAELLYHVRMTMARLSVMLAAPEPTGSGLVPAPGLLPGGSALLGRHER